MFFDGTGLGPQGSSTDVNIEACRAVIGTSVFLGGSFVGMGFS